jgi:uncharacterized oxidoreductase
VDHNDFTMNHGSVSCDTAADSTHTPYPEGAAIINVSSGLGFVPAARMPIYSASKAGLHAYSMAARVQLSKVGVKVFEVVPPPVDTELNPSGRARRGNFRANLSPREFVSAVMKSLESDVKEIGFGMTSGFIQMSRDELDRAFQRMNSPELAIPPRQA